MSLPNLLTVLRIAAIPLVAWLAIAGDPAMRWTALALYVAAAITDWLDGWLARRSNTVSPLGRMLDPIADKLLIAALIVVLAFDGTLSVLDLIPAIAIMLREVAVSGLREFMGNASIVVHVSRLAKYKTTFQLVAVAVLLAQPLVPAIGLLADALLWIAGILTVWTGYEYFRGAWPHLVGDNE